MLQPYIESVSTLSDKHCQLLTPPACMHEVYSKFSAGLSVTNDIWELVPPSCLKYAPTWSNLNFSAFKLSNFFLIGATISDKTLPITKLGQCPLKHMWE